jgi:hypothetical protein
MDSNLNGITYSDTGLASRFSRIGLLFLRDTNWQERLNLKIFTKDDPRNNARRLGDSLPNLEITE